MLVSGDERVIDTIDGVIFPEPQKRGPVSHIYQGVECWAKVEKCRILATKNRPLYPVSRLYHTPDFWRQHWAPA